MSLETVVVVGLAVQPLALLIALLIVRSWLDRLVVHVDRLDRRAVGRVTYVQRRIVDEPTAALATVPQRRPRARPRSPRPPQPPTPNLALVPGLDDAAIRIARKLSKATQPNPGGDAS